MIDECTCDPTDRVDGICPSCLAVSRTLQAELAFRAIPDEIKQEIHNASEFCSEWHPKLHSDRARAALLETCDEVINRILKPYHLVQRSYWHSDGLQVQMMLMEAT